MAPAITIDSSDDFTMPSNNPPAAISKQRTLLLSPPSLSAHQEKLTRVLEMHDRTATDMQMLDRLSMGLVSVPEATYDTVIVLSDADGTRRESKTLWSREVLTLLVQSLKPGGILRSQDGQLGSVDGSEKNEAILAGLSVTPGRGLVKPDYGSNGAVPLRLGKRSGVAKAAGGLAGADTNSVSLPLNGKRKSEDMSRSVPVGVGFDDGDEANGDDEIDSDDELIDEDTLLDEDDLKRPVKIRKLVALNSDIPLTLATATECKPKAKRRRACKDCTCGLAQKLEAEDRAKRANADQALGAFKLGADDLAEVDFTVQGKVGSCGNCSLGGLFHPLCTSGLVLTHRRCLQM